MPNMMAHCRAPVGTSNRKALTDANIDVLGLAIGRYVVHGRLGNSESALAPLPAFTNSPTNFANVWAQTMGYVVEIDVENVSMHGAALNNQSTTTLYAKKVTFRLFLHMKSGMTTNYWNASAAAEREVYLRSGMREWTAYYYRRPNLAAGEEWAWSKWYRTLHTAADNTIPVRNYNSAYVCHFSFNTNYEIDNYTPATPISIYHQADPGNGMEYFDGIGIITLNSIAVSGTPSFGGTVPTWVKAFTVTAGKKARLIIDCTGNLVTVLGVDLPTDTVVG